MNEDALAGSSRAAGALLYRSGPWAGGVAAAAGLLAAVLVPVHGWRAPIVVPLLALIAIAMVWAVRLVPAPPAHPVPVAAIVAISAGESAWAIATHSEQVVLRRDAGSYALFTQWIATHHGLPVDAMLQAFGGGSAFSDPAFRLASPAFYQVLDGSGAATSAHIVPQFLLGAPALYSLGFWFGGWTGLFITPAILFGFALLAIGGLAARLIGPRFAVLAVAVLALAQPVIHNARATYSEAPATILVMVAAALLVDAVRTLSPRLALFSGLAFGLCGLSRVDALREVSLLLPVAAVLALREPTRPLARPLVASALGSTVVAAIPAVLFSWPYIFSIRASLVPLLGFGVVLGLGSWIAVRYHAWFAARLRLPARVQPAMTAAALVVLIGVVLASRPLWMTVRQNPRDSGSQYVARMQAALGLPVDGGRTYAEHSLTWISWYLGPVTIVLAWAMFAGLAFAAVRWWVLSGGDQDMRVPVWLGPAVVGFGSLVLTLYRPGITPDHPWADRRMVPIVLPAFALAAAGALGWLVQGRRLVAPMAAAVAAIGAVLLLLPAWLGTAAVAGTSTERGELTAVRSVCAALRPGDAVIAVDDRGANEWPQLIRGVCGRPAATSKGVIVADYGAPLPALIARTRAAGSRPVLLATSPAGVRAITENGLRAQLVTNVQTTEDQHVLTQRPDGVDQLDVQVWLGYA